MNRRHTCSSVVGVSLVMLALSLSATAQEPQSGDVNRLERPEPQPLRVEKLSPELEAILKKWEQESSKVQTLRGNHYRFVYDHVFSVEKRATGRFYYEAPDKGRIDLVGMTIEKDAVSAKKDKQGQRYKLQSDQPEKWICTGQEILTIDESEKTFEVFPIPPQHQGQNIINGPLPFLFGMKAEQAKRRYKFELIPQTQNPDQYWLRVTPVTDEDLRNYTQATVILDKRTYLPTAVKLIHPGGNQETVYSFWKVEKNQTGGILAWFSGEKDPFHPNLKGYKMIQRPVVSETGEAPPTGVVPAGSSQTTPTRAAVPRSAVKPPLPPASRK